MTHRNYGRYFRVYKNDTAVIEVFTSYFQPTKLRPCKKDWLFGDTGAVYATIADVKYALRITNRNYQDYSSRAKAMEMAKAGAQNYIYELIAQGNAAAAILTQYRVDHYDDLHFNLLYDHIENVKRLEAGLPVVIIPNHHTSWY